MANEIPNLNLFMVCQKLNLEALSKLPYGYHIRNCRKDEINIWKDIHFDNLEMAEQNRIYMDNYYNRNYSDKGDLFFNTCLFVCNDNDQPIATCFAWKQYNQYTTIHWFKVLTEYEGKGIYAFKLISKHKNSIL